MQAKTMKPGSIWKAAFLAVALMMSPWPGGQAIGGGMEDAMRAYQNGDWAMAEMLWRRLARRDEDSVAMFYLGTLAAEGHLKSGPDNDALTWYRRAADKNHPGALFNLGILYWQGNEVAQDKRRAVDYWKKAARLGLTDAQYNLGTAYLNGEGVTRDKRLAFQWFEQAADQGQEDAIRALQALTESEQLGTPLADMPVAAVAAISSVDARPSDDAADGQSADADGDRILAERGAGPRR